MSEINKLVFQIAFGAVRHFGRNLYSTNPPAVAELVANAWDAYATYCKIYFNKDSMLIIDNGIGMTDREFQERYATSGKEKDVNIRKPQKMKERPYMGKKGIGKFSAFSLANEYELYTKSDQDDKWKHIAISQDILTVDEATCEVAIDRIDDIKSVLLDFGINDYSIETGTIIYLPKMKRNITANTISSLEKLLSHRFSITTIVNDGNFDVSIHTGNEVINIDLRQHFYYNDIEYVHYFGYDEKQIAEMFNNLECEQIVKEDDYEKEIKGWIGSVKIPSSLVVEDETTLKGICIYINGKLVDEDLLKNIKKDRMSDTYIIGEVDANYLGQLEDDVVLSSREGLFLDNEEVNSLKKYLEKVRKKLVAKWDDMRKSRPIEEKEYMGKLLAEPENEKLYNRLEDASKKKFDKYAQKLFDRPKADEVLDRLGNLLFSALLQIVNNEDIQKIIEEDDAIELFSRVFDLTEINHALRMRDSVKDKLCIIRKLEDYIEDGEVEKVFEEHLANNPWLIEPTWIAKTKSVKTQDYYKILKIDNKEQKLFIDIIVEVSDEKYPIVVEIKREKGTPYSTPDVNTIQTQIYNYKKGIAENYNKVNKDNIKASDIKAYFICGRSAFDKLDPNDLDLLETNGIEIRTYDSLIQTSKRIFEVHFKEDLEDI